LSPTILNRAYELLGDESKLFLSINERLEAEREKLTTLQHEVQSQVIENKQLQAELTEKRRILDIEITQIRAGAHEMYLEDIKHKRDHVDQMIADAQTAAISQRKHKTSSYHTTQPNKHEHEHHASHYSVATPFTAPHSREDDTTVQPSLEQQLEAIKSTLQAEQVQTEKELVSQVIEALNVDLLPHSGPPIVVGTRLIVLQPG